MIAENNMILKLGFHLCSEMLSIRTDGMRSAVFLYSHCMAV